MYRTPFRLQGFDGSGMWKMYTRASDNSKWKGGPAKL